MLKRKLLKFTWSYDKGMVYLEDNRNGAEFQIPMAYVDSLSRAFLAFKIAHRNELLQKTNERLAKGRAKGRKVKQEFRDYKAKVLAQKKAEAEKRKLARLKKNEKTK